MRAIGLGLATALTLLAVVGGCSRGPSLKTVPVTGKVTVDGQPLSGATVTFVPTALTADGTVGTPSSGVTGADGSYKLLTMASGRDVVDGIPPGDYKVIVTKQASGMDMSSEEMGKKMGTMTPAQMQAMSAPKSEVPDRYGKPEESGFTANIGNGAQTVDLALTSK